MIAMEVEVVYRLRAASARAFSIALFFCCSQYVLAYRIESIMLAGLRPSAAERRGRSNATRTAGIRKTALCTPMHTIPVVRYTRVP